MESNLLHSKFRDKITPDLISTQLLCTNSIDKKINTTLAYSQWLSQWSNVGNRDKCN